MPGVRLVLHSIGSCDLLKLGQRGPCYHFKAGISPGHSPVFLKVISGGWVKLWAGVLPRHIRILMEAMRQDHVVEAVGYEHMY